MSGSSPADLAVAFRSVPRRIRQALEPVAGDTSVASEELAALDVVLQRAAGVLGTPPEPAAMAEELEDRPADAWTGDQLRQLQELALRIGPLLRTVQDRAEQLAGTDG